LQPLFDYGLVIGILIVITGAYALAAPVWHGLKSRHLLAPAAAMLALGLHETADFSLEVTGVATAALALVALLTADKGSWSVSGRTFAIGSVLVALSVGAVVLLVWGRDLRGQEAALRELCARDAVACGKEGRAAARFHPAWWYPFAAVGASMDASEAWLRAASSRCPGCTGVRVALAETLARLGRPEEAGMELADVAVLRPGKRAELAAGIGSMRLAPDAMARMIAASGPVEGLVLARLVDYGPPARAIEVLWALDRLAGSSPMRLYALGRVYASEGMAREAEFVATRLIGRFPEAWQGWALQARVEASRGNCDIALHMLDEAQAASPDEPGLVLDRLECLARLERYDDFDRVAASWRARLLSEPGTAYRFHLLRAERLGSAGSVSLAAMEYDAADRLRPNDPAVPLAKARMYEAARDMERARAAYREALRRRPGLDAAEKGLKALDGEVRRGASDGR